MLLVIKWQQQLLLSETTYARLFKKQYKKRKIKPLDEEYKAVEAQTHPQLSSWVSISFGFIFCV